MTYQDVNTLISSFGLPYAYNAFPDDEPQEPPFVCFLFGPSSDFAADNTNFAQIRLLEIELYTAEKDFPTEMSIEQTLSAAGLVYSRTESYIDSERLYMVVFSAEIIITEDKNNV